MQITKQDRMDQEIITGIVTTGQVKALLVTTMSEVNRPLHFHGFTRRKLHPPLCLIAFVSV